MLKRPINLITKRLLNLQYYHLVNEKNIETISRIKIRRIFRKENYQIKQIYLHNILDDWIKNQNQLSIIFFNKLKHLIRKHKIKLNVLELHNINLLEERIFSTFRHLKVLNINLPLYEKELTYVRFDNSELYSLKNHKLTLVVSGQLLMTNKRFIIDCQPTILSLPYRFLHNYEFMNYGLKFTNQNYKTLVLRIHDQITLNATFLNLIQKRVKWLNKKLKNSPKYHVND